MKDMQKMNKKTGVLLGISVGAAALVAAACSGESSKPNPTTPVPTASTTGNNPVPPPPSTTGVTPTGTNPAPPPPATNTATPPTPPVAEPSACTSTDYEAGNDAFTSANLSGTRSVYGYGDGMTSLCKTATDPVATGAVCVEGNALPAGTDFANWGAGIGLLLAATDEAGTVVSAWDAAALGIVKVRFTAAGLEGTRDVRIGITQVNDPAITDSSKNYEANGYLSGGTSAKPLVDGLNELDLSAFKLPSWAVTALEEGLGGDLPEGGDILDRSKIHSMQLQVASNPADDPEKYKFCISNLEWLDEAGAVVDVVVEDPGGTGGDTGSDTGAVSGGDSSAPAPSGSAGGDSSAPGGSSAGDTGEAVTFADVSAIFTANCVGCHSGGGQAPNLTDEAAATAAAANIVTRVKSTDPNVRMPKGQPALPEEDIATIEAWAASL